MVEFALENSQTNYSGIHQSQPAHVHHHNHQGGTTNGHHNDLQYRPYPTMADATVYAYKDHQQCTSTGAVPKSGWGTTGNATTVTAAKSSNQPNNEPLRTTDNKDGPPPPPGKNSKTMTKTYQTIRGMISSRFKAAGGSKEDVGGNMEKNGGGSLENGNNAEPGLNNVTEESTHITSILKKSEQPTVYKRPETQFQQQQHMQMMQQQYQMLPGRSQDQMRIQQEQLYYHQQTSNNYTQQRPAGLVGMGSGNVAPQYIILRQSQYGEIKNHPQPGEELSPGPIRSQQQLERDSIRQKSFIEARRASSQPHLAHDQPGVPGHTQQPMKNNNIHAELPARHGSYGNLMETCIARPVQAADSGKDSDDGGFAREKPTDDSESRPQLNGTPKHRLEHEIGKIEGVYNLGQRIELLETTDTVEKVIDVTQRKLHAGSGTSSDYEKAGGGQTTSSNATDSGRGSAAYSSGRQQITTDDTSPESSDTHQVIQARNVGAGGAGGGESEWVDIVESELRNILDPKMHGLSLNGANQAQIANSTMSESISSMTPPLPPLSPGGGGDDGSTPNVTPRNSTRYKHSSSLPYGSKPEYGLDSYNKGAKLGLSGGGGGSSSSRWQSGPSSKHRAMGKKHMDHLGLKGKHLYGLDLADMTSTTTRSMDLESMLDGQSDSDGDISTTDARAIRKQLEGLENMYGEVLKLLGVKKYHRGGRYQPSDPRFSKRRYGSMSSLPSSSVSSRPIRDKRRGAHEHKQVKDLRGVNKRFQRLESHVVTLARSVAHLSSEMRTQHLMIQEMENIREEIAALRTQTTIVAARSAMPRGGGGGTHALDGEMMPSLANPTRVKKLTKFFGDEPPLLRLFLKSLGYEKYAQAFENERIGMVELPYLSEERLQKIGIPLGPRLRILQEAQISVCKDTTLCIV